jgi:probable phosphomutase (TIGR03848 family)
MSTIILVRHGENDWSKKNKLAGHLPGVHLNEAGHRQAQAVAQRLAALPVRAIYSSPVTRCMETAAYIADTHRQAVLQLEAVGEVRYGEWEGKKVKKLARLPLWRAVQFYPGRMRFPEGEALREVQFRAVQALETISRKHEKDLIVVVSHADVIRLVLAYYLGIHIDLFQRLVISPAAASVIVLGSDGFVRVLRMNDDGPLQMTESKDKKKPKEKAKRGRFKKSSSSAHREAVGSESADDIPTVMDEEE